MLRPPFKSDSQPLTEEEKKQEVPLYNPLLEDFEAEYYEDDNSLTTLKMPAGQITYFPKPKANFMAKHLADAVVNLSGEKVRANALKEIWVKI